VLTFLLKKTYENMWFLHKVLFSITILFKLYKGVTQKYVNANGLLYRVNIIIQVGYVIVVLYWNWILYLKINIL
jgi:hypothetical protein